LEAYGIPAVKRLRDDWQVLATAASNIAVDNLVERLAAAAPRLALVRTGHAARLLPSVRALPSVNLLAAVGHTAAAASKLTLAHADRSLEAIWVIPLASMQCARPLPTWRAGMPCMHQPLALTSLWRTNLTRCASYQLMVHSNRSEKGGTGMGPGARCLMRRLVPPQVLAASLEAQVLASDSSALARDCRREMKAATARLLKLGRKARWPSVSLPSCYTATTSSTWLQQNV